MTSIVVMGKNYDYYMRTNLSSYIGKWVAICNERIVSEGDNPKKVYFNAKKKFPNQRLMLTKVPEKEAMIF